MEKTKNISILSKRISAYLIDILFVFLLISLITEIKFINPTYDKYMEAYSNYTEILEDYTDEIIDDNEFNKLYNQNYYEVCKYSVSYNVVIVLTILLYFGVFQKYNNGQTLGKKVMKIRVVDSNNNNISLLKSLLRTIPMYYVYIGGIIPLIINSILVYFLNANNYMNITLVISYIFLTISLVSFVMLSVRKDEKGLHDMLSGTKVIYDEK